MILNNKKIFLLLSLFLVLIVSGCSSSKSPTISHLEESSMYVDEGEEKSIRFVPDTSKEYYKITRSDVYKDGNVESNITEDKFDISKLNDEGEVTLSESLGKDEIRKASFIVESEELASLVRHKVYMSPQNYDEPVVVSKVTDSYNNSYYTDSFSHIQLISKEKASAVEKELTAKTAAKNKKNSEPSSATLTETYSDDNLTKYTVENLKEGMTIEITGESDGVVTAYLKTIYDDQLSSDISSGGQFVFYFNPSVPNGGNGSFHVEIKNANAISFNIEVY